METDKQKQSGFFHVSVKGVLLILSVIIVVLVYGVEGALAPYLSWLLIVLLVWGLENPDEGVFTTILIGVALSILLITVQGFLYKTPNPTPILTVPPLGTVTSEGIQSGVVGSLKILCVLFSAQAFVASTTIEELGYLLRKLRVPDSAVFVLVTGMRFTTLVIETWRDILNSMRLRGIDIDKEGIWKRITDIYPRSIVPLILSLFRRGLDLEIAIATRGFYSDNKKTQYYKFPMQYRDYFSISGLILSFFVVTYFIL
jgi:energy-coupling factor transporter transmembrane protein EcfT